MLQYPSIVGSKHAPIGENCIAFYKYDGSNLRWEWSPKRGWHKFGTRRQLFDANTPLYCQAVPLFLDGPADSVVKSVLRNNPKCERITAFTEFFGSSSFAGSHNETEDKQLKLLDVFVFKKGFIPAEDFVQRFQGHSWSPEVIYQGELTQEFVDAVRNGQYPVYEGVICKGSGFMAKIKTIEYLNRLKSTFVDDWQNYAE